MERSLTEALQKLGELQEEAEKSYGEEADSWWDSLDKDTQLQAFYSVVKRLYKGEMQDEGSYRYILYDVFGFGLESYGIGMMCGYLELHNAIDPDYYKRKPND